MERNKLMIGLVLLSMLLGGCALGRPEKMEGSPVRLEVVSSRPAFFSEASAVRSGEELIVSGAVRKYHRFYLPGHVDVVVCAPDGKMLGQVQQRLMGGGYLTSRGGAREARFTTRLHLTPPVGAKVRVRYHAPSSGDEHLKCV